MEGRSKIRGAGGCGWDVDVENVDGVVIDGGGDGEVFSIIVVYEEVVGW